MCRFQIILDDGNAVQRIASATWRFHLPTTLAQIQYHHSLPLTLSAKPSPLHAGLARTQFLIRRLKLYS